MKKRSAIRLLGAAITAVLLASCGGGGGGETTTALAPDPIPAPAPAPAPAPVPTAPAAPVLNVSYDLKELVFSWAAVSGADYYKLSEEESAGAGYVQLGGDLTATSYSHDIASVHLHDWLNASYILEACNSVGCTSSTALFPMDSASAIGYFKASNTGAGDYFGYAVAMSGDGQTLAVGAVHEDSAVMGINQTPSGTANDSGAVYVFSNNNGFWEQEAYIKAPDVTENDNFGTSLALSGDGNTLVVGMSNEDPAADAGAAYVYLRSNASWSEQAYIQATNAEAGDFFGGDVALSSNGDTLAVGAYGNSNGTGAAYILTRTNATWTEQAIIRASNFQTNDNFGYSVSLSGDGATLAVSATREDSGTTGVGSTSDENAPDSGAVYIFTWDGANWLEEEYIKASNTSAADNFGVSLALSSDGNTLVVGANHEDGLANDSGAAYVFSRNGVVWDQQAYLKASNVELNDEFGYAVALSNDGNNLLVSAWAEDSGAVGIDGSQVSNGMDGAGAAYYFTRNGGVWTQEVYIKASNTGNQDVFGSAVAVSGDASTLLIGGFGESSNATGISGDQTDNSAGVAGAAYLY